MNEFSADLEFPPPPLDLPPMTESSVLHSSRLATISNDLATTAPSVEEASSRFGVTLRSTDSCSSLGSSAAAINEVIPTIGVSVMNKNKIKLETKIVSEIKERNEQYLKKCTDVPNAIDYHYSNNNNVTKSNEYVLQSVDDAVECFKHPKTDFTGSNPKTQLKKVEIDRKAQESSPVPFDFKSRLRKVENNNENEMTDPVKLKSKSVVTEARGTVPKNSVTKRCCDMAMITSDQEITSSCKIFSCEKKDIETRMYFGGNLNGRSNTDKFDGEQKKNTTPSEEEDKRRSAGSISSLKKIWEAKDGSGSTSDLSQIQFSPKLTPNAASQSIINKGNDEEFDILINNKKPIVPTKPVNIYATPISIKQNTDLSSPTSSNNTSSIISENNTSHMGRETILELVQLLENTLKTPINSISASQWLQLSDKLHILHTTCVSFTDNAAMAPHSKFQFRELASRIENQSRNLRSASSRNSKDIEKLVVEIGQLLKQVSNALFR